MSKNIKILVLTTSFPRYSGDWAGVFIKESIDALSVLGQKVLVLAPRDDGNRVLETDGHITIKRFRSTFPWQKQKLAYGSGIPVNLRNSHSAKLQTLPFLFSFLFNSYFLSKKTDIIHAHWLPAGAIGAIVARARSMKLVITIHGSDWAMVSRSKFWRKIAKVILGKANKIIMVSPEMLKQCNEIYDFAEKAKVVFNSVPDEFIQCEKEYGESKALKILFVGRIIRAKGIFELIDAFEIINRQHKNVELHLIGSGGDKQELSQYITGKPSSRNIFMHGALKKTEILKHLSNSSIFVLPSYSEGAPLSVLEAMATGTAVVATSVGGVPGIIENGHTGLLVEAKNVDELASAVSTLINDKELRSSIERNAKNWAIDNCKQSKMAHDLMEIYESLVEN